MNKIVYAVRSNISKKYLTSLFSDSHNKTFTAKEFKNPSNGGNCYYWNIKENAEAIAYELNGYIEELTLLEQ